MKVIIWGMGYVGTTAAACLAKLGHSVIGVENNPMKLKALAEGKTFMKESDLDELLSSAKNQGLFKALADGTSELKTADVSMICVGTPSAPDGSPNLDHICRVAQSIGEGLKGISHYHVIALRCTVPPGTARELLTPIIERASGKKVGVDFGLVSNPEFLREGTSVADFFNPPYTLIGGVDDRSTRQVAKLYESIEAPIYFLGVEEAELIKMVNNAFHALKIGFSNEISRLSDRAGIDAHRIMDFVCKDTKLNISKAYLRPGFAFGGSCLPKDLRSIEFQGRKFGLELPILASILRSNQLHLNDGLTKVFRSGAQSVTILGLSFKSDTDDMRESPAVEFIRKLWHDGVKVSIYDPDVTMKTLHGANLEYAKRQLPNLEEMLCDTLQESLSGSQLAVVTKKHPVFSEYISDANRDLSVLDLVQGVTFAPTQASNKAA